MCAIDLSAVSPPVDVLADKSFFSAVPEGAHFLLVLTSCYSWIMLRETKPLEAGFTVSVAARGYLPCLVCVLIGAMGRGASPEFGLVLEWPVPG